MSSQFLTNQNCKTLWSVIEDLPEFKQAARSSPGQIEYIWANFQNHLKNFSAYEKTLHGMSIVDINKRFLGQFIQMVFPRQQPQQPQHPQHQYLPPQPPQPQHKPNFADVLDDPSTKPDINALSIKIAQERGFEPHPSSHASIHPEQGQTHHKPAPPTDILSKLKQIAPIHNDYSDILNNYQQLPQQSLSMQQPTLPLTQQSSIEHRLDLIEQKLNMILDFVGSKGERISN